MAISITNPSVGGGIGDSGQKYIDTIRCGHPTSNDSAVPKSLGTFEFNPTKYALSGATRAIILRVVAHNVGGISTTRAQLYNVTDAEFVGSPLDFTSASPTKKEQVIAEGSGTGEIDSAVRIYEVRIWAVSPDEVDDSIKLGSAELVVENTIT